MTADGQEILYHGKKETYPIFINEAAYYEKGIAFISTEKANLNLPSLSVKMTST